MSWWSGAISPPGVNMTIHQANFEQKRNLVRILSGACDYGYYRRREQWHIHDGAKNILKALAHFETGAFGQYPDGIDDLLSEEGCLWYDVNGKIGYTKIRH